MLKIKIFNGLNSLKLDLKSSKTWEIKNLENQGFSSKTIEFCQIGSNKRIPMSSMNQNKSKAMYNDYNMN